MACDLGKQGTRYPFDTEGENGVLDGAFVSDLGEHLDKARCLLIGQAVADGLDRGR